MTASNTGVMAARRLRQFGLNPKDYPDAQAANVAIADFKRGKTPQEIARISSENQSRMDSAADENVAYPATTSEETQPASEATEAGAQAAFAEGGMQGFLEYVEAHKQQPPPKTEEGAKAAYAEGGFQKFLEYADDGTTTNKSTKPTVVKDDTTSQPPPPGDDGTTTDDDGTTSQQQYESLVASGEIKAGDFQSFLDYSAPGGDDGTTTDDDGTTSQQTEQQQYESLVASGEIKAGDFQGFLDYAGGQRRLPTTDQPPPPGDGTTTDQPPVPGEDYGSIRPGEDRSVRKDSEAAYEQGGLDGFLKFAEDHVTSAPLFERKIQTGFEDLIANRVKDLEYDRETVVAEGVAEIDRSFQDAAQELARFANLSPGGPDSGQVIDKMERLLLSRETSKLELKQRAREKEFEAADKAIARMTETANTFFGQDVTRAGMTGEFRGETTVQEEQRKIDNENAVTEMYGGKPPTIMSVDEFKRSMNSQEGDDAYNPAFDTNKDGKIGFQDWIEVTQNGVMMDDGRIAYGAGPRTVAGQQMDQKASQFADTHGLDKEKFTEATRQFDEELQQNIDKFRSSFTGQMMHTDENGKLVFDKDPNTGLPFTSMQKAEFDQDVAEFNQTFEENIRQFGIEAGFTKEKLRMMRNKNWADVVANAFTSIFQRP